MKQSEFSYHTFMLRKQLLRYTEKHAMNKFLFDKKHYMDSYGTMRCCLNIPGLNLCIRYYESQHPALELVVNPYLLLGNASYKMIFNPVLCSILQVENLLNAFLLDNNLPFLFEDFILARLDLCVNIALDSHEQVETYLRLMKKSYIPHKYDSVTFPDTMDNATGKNHHSFRIQSAKKCFTVYDKDYQMLDQGLQALESDEQNLLRFEISLQTEAITKLKKQYHIETTAEFLDKVTLLGISAQRFASLTDKIFPYGEYCSFQGAKEKLEAALLQKGSYEAAIGFLQYVSRCQNVNAALALYMGDKDLSRKQMNTILANLAIAGVNPVTIPEICLPHRNKDYTMMSIHKLLFGEMESLDIFKITAII